MSNNNSGLLNGIVRKTNHRYPAGVAGHWAISGAGLGPKVNELVGRFVTSCKYVYRAGGLSRPLFDLNPQTTEALCHRALAYVNQFMGEHPTLEGRDFVIMDGTAWDAVVPSDLFGYDVIYIAVFWRSKTPVVAIVTGPRKWLKTTTMASLVVEASLQVTIINYDPLDSHAATTQKLRNSIFGSTNFNQLKNFGTPIVRAVEDTIDQGNEYPIAAANWLDGVIWYVERPHRHHHILQSVEYQEASKGNHDREVQGFLTNHGNFVTRYRAMLMAVENKMIVDTPEMQVMLTRSSSKMFHPMETQMGGIIRERDKEEKGFLISVTPLFSEDLF